MRSALRERAIWRWLAIATITVAGACAEPRPRDDGACLTWKDDIEPQVAAACSSCHAGATPAGRYDLTSYLGALGAGTDTTANAIAGDATSLLVTTLAPATATPPHAGQAALYATLARWVGTCDVAYLDSPLHPGGILDPASTEFHGKELLRRDWNLPLCATCHGADFGGSSKAPSCKTCHTQGPTACDTCHPARPTSGAHTSHLERAIECTSCHVVPTVWNQPGHILVDGVADPAPAEVAITGFATTTIVPADRTGPPTYDPATSTCGQVYCHGAVLGDAGGMSTRPVWTNDPPGPAPCSSCHGAPPPTHARSRCAECHPSGANHLDGAIEIGDATPPTCSGCHGSATSPAPPRDLEGNTATSAIGVGAHQAHLIGPHRLAPPIACVTCHVVPATLMAPGHIDDAGPAEVTAAFAWDRTSQTCGSAWCHGPARPVWTGTEPAFCGSCHGAPPATPAHQPSMPLSSCTTCHPRTVNGFGAITITDGPNGPVSTHMNGVVDAP